MSDVAPLLELLDGYVRLERTEILHGVDFRVEKGDFVVLLGPNGSGKSTLIKALLGLLPLASGQVRLYGRSLRDFDGWDLIGYVPQRVTATAGVPATVQEVVLSGRAGKLGLLGRYKSADREAVERALELVDLAEVRGQPVGALSGGQQQRVLIARALAADPEVLVMDEPVASVDVAHQESLALALSELNDAGTSILLVAHSLGALQPLVKRAVVLEGGRIVYDGAPSHAVVHAHAHPHHEVGRSA